MTEMQSTSTGVYAYCTLVLHFRSDTGVSSVGFSACANCTQAHQQLNKTAGTSSSLHSSHSDSVEPESGSFMQWFNAAQQQEQENPASWLQQSLHSFFQLPASTALQQYESPDLGSVSSEAGGRPRRFASLQAVKGVDMSLTIRAARNLPTHMLTDEFHKCLKRRHATVRADADMCASCVAPFCGDSYRQA